MGGVYIIAHRLDDGWAPPCKIGISASWPNRLSSLQSGNPKPIGLYAYFDIGDRSCALQTEKFLHSRLADKRLTGEWFQVDPAYASIFAQFFITSMIHSGAQEFGAYINAVEFVRSITSGPGALPASDSGES